MGGLNRTSVGLKAAAGALLYAVLDRPQSNQRGIERAARSSACIRTPRPQSNQRGIERGNEATLFAAQGRRLNRTSVGLKVNIFKKSVDRMGASIEPAWD